MNSKIVEAPQDEFEHSDDVGDLELETADLPEVDAPFEIDEDVESTPEPAETLVAEDFAAIMEAEEIDPVGEAVEPVLDEESFATTVRRTEPFLSDDEDGEFEPPESRSNRQLTDDAHRRRRGDGRSPAGGGARHR